MAIQSPKKKQRMEKTKQRRQIEFLMKWLFITTTLFVLAFSTLRCTPQRKLNRLIRKHPELVKTDTLTITDTVRVTIPGTEIDTVVQFKNLTDTVVLVKENMTVKVFQRNDSIFIQAKTDTITKTVIHTKKVPYEKIVTKRQGYWIPISLILLFVIYLFLWPNRN